ncbi:MAG: hypothetical protein KJ822_03795 [Proteobacteria bacterium]|nr:hypothetical protein [Pseudomonadota bacterium]
MVILPEKAYQRLAFIELEKKRRDKDKKRASQLMADIETNLQEIEAERALLLKGLKLPGLEEGNPNLQTQPGPRHSSGGFKVRY